VWLKQEVIIKPVIGYLKCNTARKKDGKMKQSGCSIICSVLEMEQ